MIVLLPGQFTVADAVSQLQAQPVWDLHTSRTQRYGTPHAAVSDVWVRFNDPAKMHTDPVAFFQGEHESVWYPCASLLPAVVALIGQVFRAVGGKRLGGVLVTRIPPGGRVEPHIDTGWHAGYYEKFAVQLQGNERQSFCFEDSALSATPGQLYTFDNSKLHWVVNDSAHDRMTLIICIRR